MMDYEIKERFYLYQIQHCQSPLFLFCFFFLKNPRVTYPNTDNVPRYNTHTDSIFHDYGRKILRSTSRWEKMHLNISVSY